MRKGCMSVLTAEQAEAERQRIENKKLTEGLVNDAVIAVNNLCTHLEATRQREKFYPANRALHILWKLQQ